MKKILIIPARYQSTRFPGKPLVKLQGTECVIRTCQAAREVKGLDAIYVATDDERIADTCEQHNVSVVMTSRHCVNGSERVAEATKILKAQANDIIINLQGDAPLTPPWFIDAIIDTLTVHPDTEVVTPVIRCDEAGYQRLIADRQQHRVGGTTVIVDRRHRALYFSKEVIPYLSVVNSTTVRTVYHHVGVYGYRAAALALYSRLGSSCLEEAEQLEQLRFIENGIPVRVVEVEARGKAFWELNNPEDVAILEAMLLNNNRSLSGS